MEIGDSVEGVNKVQDVEDQVEFVDDEEAEKLDKEQSQNLLNDQKLDNKIDIEEEDEDVDMNLKDDEVISSISHNDSPVASSSSQIEKETHYILLLMREFYSIVNVSDRRYRLKLYKDIFVGCEAVDSMVLKYPNTSRERIIQLLRKFMSFGLFHHVAKNHSFKDEYLFYRFNKDYVELHSINKKNEESIENINVEVLEEKVDDNDDQITNEKDNDLSSSFLNVMKELDELSISQEEIFNKILKLGPVDNTDNQRLVHHCHPLTWKNPAPKPIYNLVVVGAGVGGLVTAAIASSLGAKVALIEMKLMGGDCLNVGCVPSKALLRSAKQAYACKPSVAAKFGIEIEGEVKVDFKKVMNRIRRIRADISHHDSAKRFSETLGVDVFIGRGVFTANNIVQVNNSVLKFKKAVIATGSRSNDQHLGIKNFKEVLNGKYLTNETVFNLTVKPEKLCVIGAGPIGCELTQAFARLGSKVSLCFRSPHILKNEDFDAAKILEKVLVEEDEVDLVSNVKKYVEVRKLKRKTEDSQEDEKEEQPLYELILELQDGSIKRVVFTHLLIASGRLPNIEGLGLKAAGVKCVRRMDPVLNEYINTGVFVDKYFKTTNSNIYAVGDVAYKYKFTHAADFTARTVVRNALFFGFGKSSDLLIPWCTYTSPEISHVGFSEREAEMHNIKYKVFEKKFDGIDRSICDSDEEGFIKVLVNEGTDKIIGCTIVNSNAGDMINHMVTIIRNNVGLKKLSTEIYCYPTVSEAVRKLGDEFNRTRLTPMAKTALSTLLSIRKTVG